MTDCEIAYMAGIVDGEGHFCKPINKRVNGREYRQRRLVIQNINKDLIDWLRLKFGGTIVALKRKFPWYQDAWQWTLHGQKATDLAKLMQPFLIVKKEQVKRVL